MSGQPPDTEAESIDLHTLLGQFAALRHEVNLQTKAVRAQQEQNAQTLAALQQALATPPPAPSPASNDAALKTMMEPYDSFALAPRSAARVRGTMLPPLN